MAPRGAWGREAKHSARIGLRSLSPCLGWIGLRSLSPCLGWIGPRFLSPCFGAQSSVVFGLARSHPSLERIKTFPLPWAPSPWDSSFSLSWWVPAEEVELTKEEQEVGDEEIVVLA